MTDGPQMADEPSGEYRPEPALTDADSVLTTLIEQMHRNWDQGNTVANDDLVVRIREHIRSQLETATTAEGSHCCYDAPSP